MKAFGTSLIREVVQKGVGIVVVWIAAHGFAVPDAVSNWVVLTIVAGGVVVWTAIVRFLETREGGAWKLLAKILMLGASGKGKTPVYPAAEPEAVTHLRNVAGR